MSFHLRSRTTNNRTVNLTRFVVSNSGAQALEAAGSLSASGSQTRLREERLLKRSGLAVMPSLVATVVWG